MKIRLEKITKKDLSLFQYIDGEKSIKIIDGIATTSFQKSYVDRTSISADLNKNLISGIANYVKQSRNGIRCIINGEAKQLIFRKAGEEYNPDNIDHLGVFMRFYNDQLIYFYYDKQYIDKTIIELDIDFNKPFTNITEKLLVELYSEPKFPKFEKSDDVISFADALEKIYAPVFEWVETQNFMDLVEVDKYEFGYVGFERLTETQKVDSQVIRYVQSLNSFIFANMTGYENDKRYIHPLVFEIQKLIQSYHKDKSPVKDHVFRDKLFITLNSYYSNLREFIKDTINKETEKFTDDCKCPEYVPEITEEPKKEIIEEQAIEKENEEDMARKAKLLREKEIEAMKKAKEAGLTKEQMANDIGTMVGDAIDSMSLKQVKSNIAKMIFMQLDKFGDDVLDLAKQLIKESNKYAEVLQRDKKFSTKVLDKIDPKEAYFRMETLRKVSSWIIEFKNTLIQARVKNQMVDIDTVILEGGNVIFSFYNTHGFPYIIDAQSLQCILEFEPISSNYQFNDMKKEDFMMKHDDFLKASGLCSSLFVDNGNILDPDTVIKATYIPEPGETTNIEDNDDSDGLSLA